MDNINSSSYKEIRSLWDMEHRVFNTWRRKNDLLNLISTFEKQLPYFKEWMNEYNLSKEKILLSDSTGAFFNGENFKYFRFYGYDLNDYPIVHVKNNKYCVDQPDFRGNYELIEEIKFLPYLSWVNNTNQYKMDKKIEIRFSRWSEPSDKTLSTACILKSNLELLKMGSITIDDNVVASSKNLDFVNLDHLTIKNNSIGIFLHKNIAFSSVRNFNIFNTELYGTKFVNCVFEGTNINECIIKSIKFHHSKIDSLYFKNCTIFSLTMNDTALDNLFINSSIMYEIDYTPKKNTDYLQLRNQYSQIRKCFYDSNNKHYAGRYLLKEQQSLRKYYFSSYRYPSKWKYFPEKKYYYNLRQIIFNRYIPKKNRIDNLRDLLIYELKVTFIPKYILIRLRFKINFATSVINNLFWGYGERPSRVIISTILTILLFGILYFFSDNTQLHNDYINSLYYSVTTFTTLGYGDITPGDDIYLKIISIIEALTGVTFMGFIVGSFSKKMSS